MGAWWEEEEVEGEVADQPVQEDEDGDEDDEEVILIAPVVESLTWCPS